MNTALKVIGILSTIAGLLGQATGILPGTAGIWVAGGGIILHQVAHTVGDILDDGQLNDSYKG